MVDISKYNSPGGGAAMGFELLGGAAIATVAVVASPVLVAGAVLLGCEPVPITGNRCTECHDNYEDPENPKPLSEFKMYDKDPRDSHIFHVMPRYTNPIACSTCHDVVSKVWGAETHADKKADVNLGKLGEFDPVKKTCTTSKCHGDEKKEWKTDHAEPTLKCNSCHKETKPKHTITELEECGKCHTETVNSKGEIKSKDNHLDGEVEVVVYTCDKCHGQPPDTHKKNNTVGGDVKKLLEDCSNCHPVPNTTFHKKEGEKAIIKKDGLCSSCHEEKPTTGAHTTHLNAWQDGFEPKITCKTCHDVPTAKSGLLEHFSIWEIVTFGGLGTVQYYIGNLDPQYDQEAKECSSISCHGAGLEGGEVKKPNWNDVSGKAKACGACHGIPTPTLIHEGVEKSDCAICHSNSSHNGKIEHD